MFRIWVELFNCNDFDLINQAYNVLLRRNRTDYLKKYSTEIKKGIIKYRVFACEREDRGPCIKFKQNKFYYKEINQILPGDKLYMLLPLSKEEKEIMLKKLIPESSFLHYRARIGDKDAEMKLIEQFKKANKFGAKMKLAYHLGIAGTPECARTLALALNSPLIDKRRSGSYMSIRIFIIKALRKINPEVLFLRDISFISFCEDKAYGGKEKIKSFLDKVINWAEKKYNIKPLDKPPEPLLYKSAPEF